MEKSVAVKIRAEIAEFRRDMATAAASGEKLAKSLEGVARSASRSGEAADAAARKSGSAFSKMAQSAKDHEQAWNRAGTSLLTAGTLITAGVGVMIARYAAFDKQMSSVQAATHETAANMGLLRQAAIEAGADTAFSAQEAGKGIEELAKAGVSTKDVLSGGLSGALSLAAAGSLDVGQAAELAATAMSQFNLSGKDIPHLADLLAAAAGKAQGSVQDIGQALAQSGLVASQFGLSVDETVGSLAAFANAGLIGSDAGTSLKNALLKLAAPSKEAAGTMERLGINAYDTHGKFVGLQNLAGQLKTRMEGLTQAERDQALATIFGTDAIRVANVLYKEGADGIAEWTSKVSASGYAAATAAIQQDNLAGDFEKLGGSLDSVFLKSGSAANDILRGLTQSAEDLVDMIGGIPQPVLQTTLVIAGLTGGALLLGGAFLKAVPSILETRAAFATLSADSPKLAGALGKVGKFAGIAFVALTALTIAKSLFTSADTTSAEDYANALLGVTKSGGKLSDLDPVFKNFGKSLFTGETIDGINGVSDAVNRLTHQNFNDWMNDGPIGAIGKMITGSSDIDKLRAKFVTLGESMGEFVKNGGLPAAQDGFRKLSDEFVKNGKSAGDALAAMPAYKDALLDQAKALGVQLEGQDLVNYALGQTPPAMLAAAGATNTYTDAGGNAQIVTEAMAKQLDGMGISAQGAVTSLSKYVDLLTQAGLLTLSARDAQRNYVDSLNGIGLAADGTGGKLGSLGTAFDNTTAQGLKNQATFDGVAKSGLSLIDSMSKATDAFGNNTYSQQQLQTQLSKVYTDLITTAGQFGITGTAADSLARKVLGIPAKANVNTWMSDYAKKMAEQTTGAVNAIPSYKAVTVATFFEQHGTPYSDTAAPGGANGKSLPFVKRADGGSVVGPGTGTSDSIPALLSNGEHVLTASDVLALGGQDGVYRMRRLAQAGLLPAFADGGAVDSFVAAGLATGGSAAKAALKARQAAAKAAEARRRELAKATQWRNEQASALYLDDARGESWRSVRNLSSGYGFSDRLRTAASSGNINSQRGYLNSVANSSDAALRNLYARSESLGKSLDTAKTKLQDLTQVRDKVRDNLASGFDIGQASLFAARSGGGVTSVQARASKYLATIQAFGAKLSALQKKGYSGAILDEIASMGSVDGSRAADALLAGTAAQVVGLNKTYTDIGLAASRAGDAVTNAMFKGGVNAAAGIVQGLQSQQGAIEKQMMNIGLGMEKALKKALGIRSPSRKMLAITDNVTGTAVDGLKAGIPAISAQAKAMGDAMIEAPSKQLAGAVIGGDGFSSTVPASAGLDNAALDRLTEAVKAARSITVQATDTEQATLMSVARGMRGF